jgi:hypothetical protein
MARAAETKENFIVPPESDDLNTKPTSNKMMAVFPEQMIRLIHGIDEVSE